MGCARQRSVGLPKQKREKIVDKNEIRE